MTGTDIDLQRLHQFIPFDCLSESHLRDIAGQIEVLKLGPSRVLFKRGDTADKAYFLIAGAMDLIDASFQVRKFPADDDENYLALDNYARHNVNAISTETSTVYAIGRDKLDLLMTWTQAAESMLEADADEGDRDWMDALLQSDLFAQIPPQRIQSLFVKFTERDVSLGECIVQEGEPGDTFYVIKRGKAMITRSKGAKQETIAALSSGHFFGEDALISDAPRNASVTMTSDGTLMILGKQDFSALLKDSVIRHVSEAELDRLEEEEDRAVVRIDVRLAMEFRHDRASGARNIPLNELRHQVRSLEKNFLYVVSCDGGRRSELGAYLLTEAGLEAYVLERATPTESEDQDEASHTAE